jgi:uncharacterized protein with PIN domain
MPDLSGPKFLADENVSKLGKWLRILGYDVAYQSPATDGQLALKALRENRVILTRDRDFSKRRMVEQCLLLTSQDTVEQLKEVIQTFELEPNQDRFFTRCLACNAVIQPIAKEKARAAVPDYVYRTHDQFHQCPVCNKLFWRGSHISNFQKWLQRMGENGQLGNREIRK